MNAQDAGILHEVIAADAHRRAGDAETELRIDWRRHCDRRRHERTTRPGTATVRVRRRV